MKESLKEGEENRADGYYWIKHYESKPNTDWSIGLWDSGKWIFPSFECQDSYLAEIDETQIVRNMIPTNLNVSNCSLPLPYPVEPKEESTPDFKAMAKEACINRDDDGKYYATLEDVKQVFERIWKEHHLPLKEERDSQVKEKWESIEDANKTILALQSELKDLREENENKQIEIDNLERLLENLLKQ